MILRFCRSFLWEIFFVDFFGLLGCFLVGIYFPYCNWIILVSSDRKYFSLLVVEWLWGKRSHHHVSSCVANDDKQCIWACFWQTLQKMSVGCIHQDFQVVFFLFDVFVKNHQKLPQKPPGTNGTKANLVVTYAFQGCGGVLEAHVPHQSTRLKKGGLKNTQKQRVFVPFWQEILRRLVVVLAEHLQLHSMKNRVGIFYGKTQSSPFCRFESWR